MADLKSLSNEDLAALVASKKAEAAAIFSDDTKTPSLAEIEQAEEALAESEAAKAELAEREASEKDLADRAAAAKAAAFADDEPDEPADKDDEPEPADEPVDEPVATDAPADAPAEPAAAASRVAALRGKVDRPKAPAAQRSRVSIVAAAEVPDFAANQSLDIPGVADALVSRLKAFGTPQGDGKGQDLRFAGVAKFALDFPDDLKVDRNSDALSVINRATDESRLKSEKGAGSLVAAGGWCTPSENLYDLCEGETLDGLISVPEVQINRGGINFTKGPDFSTLFNDPDLGWVQTEAQAEAGTSKPCYEIVCPDWTDVRLDAVGLCIKVPILTNAAFPELTQRTIRGAMVAHQHKINADVIGRMVTLAGAPTTAIDYTTTAQSLWSNLARIAYLKRQSYKLGLNESLEVILPAWTLEALRDDLSLRTGRPLDEVTDAYIMREFAVRNLAVQFVYDWQELPATAAAEGYPATVDVLMYPAGTYIKGVSDVINLSAVYDAASLAVNVFTGLFFEEGLLVANTCYDADLVTVPVCNSGRTGAADLVVCGVDTTP